MSLYSLQSTVFFLLCTGLSPGLSSAEDCEPAIVEATTVSTNRLRDALLHDYDKTVRPVLSHTQVTSVYINTLIEQVDLHEYSSTLSVECWLAMLWTDAHLQWNPKDYDGQTELTLTSGDIWMPDLSVYNQFAYSSSKILDDTHKCVVNATGTVGCVAQATLAGNCVPDLTYWPFDSQNCTIYFGSWLHHGEEINYDALTLAIIENPEEPPKTEWQVTGLGQRKEPGIYACCPNNTYPSVLLSFVLKRYVGSNFAGVVLPILMFIAISLLTLWLDPKAPERLYLTALNIPCHIIFLQNVVWGFTEPGDSVPYVILLFRDSLLLVCLTLVETTVVRWLLDTRSSTPAWLVTSVTVVVNSKPGQVLLFSELNDGNAVANLSAEGDDTLAEPLTKRPKEWHLLGRAIDRVYFAVYILTYFIMILVCVPQ